MEPSHLILMQTLQLPSVPPGTRVIIIWLCHLNVNKCHFLGICSARPQFEEAGSCTGTYDTSSFFCSEKALHIVHAAKEDGQLMCLSFLKLKSALWENNLFPFLLDTKETYFEIVLLMLFFFFYVEILLILSLQLLLMLCVHSSVQCVLYVRQWICGHMPVSEWFLCQLFVLSVWVELFSILSTLFIPSQQAANKCELVKTAGGLKSKSPVIFECAALQPTSLSQSRPDFSTKKAP